MSRFRSWVQRQIHSTKSKPLWILFMKGVQGQLNAKNPKPYNLYINIIKMAMPVTLIYYFMLFRKNQMDLRGYNLFVPEYVYKVREESYIYWETVRNAKGMPTMLTFYKWDDNIMFQIDREGTQTPIQTHKGLENEKTFTSALHEYNFPASPETHNRILMYLKNINNPYNLQNYLRFKAITLGDWVRAAYFFIYRELGLTNRWRYDEFVRKPDIYYRIQKIRLAYRLNRDRKTLYRVIDELRKEVGWEETLRYLIWVL